MIKKTGKRITHLNLQDQLLDPYELVKNKTLRLSWNRISDANIYLDKNAVIDWFALLRDYSDNTVEMIITEGLFNNKLHDISYILKLTQNSDFSSMPSEEIYQLLYEFVDKTPQGVQCWLEDSDYMISRDLLAILSKS